MLSGSAGWELAQPTLSECSRLSTGSQLFDAFKLLDSQLRPISQTYGGLEIKVGKEEKVMKLFHRIVAGNWEAYSRAARMDDGKWVTVQVRRFNGLRTFNDVVDFFGDKGAKVASIKWACDGDSVVEFGDRQFIAGALQAVTGRPY